MKKIFLLLIFTLSCQTNANKSNKVLRLNISQDPISFDPRQGGDNHTSIVLGLLFDGLMKEEKGTLKKNLASDVHISKDHLTYTFKLKDALWSNGEKITAQDFEHTWKRVLDPNFETSYAYMFYTIKNARAAKANKKKLSEVGIRALDEKTLQVQLEHPAPYFLQQLSRSIFFPIYHKLDKEFPNWAHPKENRYVSNGAFLLDTYEDTNELILKKNPCYHDAKKIYLNAIQFSFIDNPTTTYDLFVSGELDWLGQPMIDLSQELINSAKKQYSLHSLQICSVALVEFNTKIFPFSNPNIRKAFTFALNRKELIKSRAFDEEIATSFLPPQTQLQKEPYFKDHDEKKALQYLEKGLSELNIKKSDLDNLTLGFNSSESNKKIMQILQQQWKKALGIHVNLHSYEWKVFFDLLGTEELPLGMYSWSSELDDPIYNLNLFQYTDNNLNSSGWSDPGYVALLEMSECCRKKIKRKQILHLAEKIFIEAMPICPLYYIKGVYFKKTNLKGVNISKMGNVNFKKAYFK